VVFFFVVGRRPGRLAEQGGSGRARAFAMA
jgi:hypothetical protein